MVLAGLMPAQTGTSDTSERSGVVAPGGSDSADAPAAPPSTDDADAAAAPGSVEPVRLLLLDIHAESEARKAAELLSNLLAEAVSQADGIEVNTSADLRRLMALEAEKAVMGCDEESCLGEIAGAFGVPYIVFGKLSTLGDVTTLSLSLFDADAARPVWRKNLQAPSAPELQYEIAAAAEDLLSDLAKRQPSISYGAITGPERPTAGLPWVLMGGIGIGAVGAVGLFGTVLSALVLSELVYPLAGTQQQKTFAYWGAVAASGAAVVALGVALTGVGVTTAGLMVME